MILNKENLQEVANDIRSKCTKGTIVLISGPMGVGKTTLIKHIIPEFEVKSPSFLHALCYGNFMHIDAYTFQSIESFLALNIEEALQDYIIIIEWGNLLEDVVKIFDAPILKIDLEYFDNENRKIFFEK